MSQSVTESVSLSVSQTLSCELQPFLVDELLSSSVVCAMREQIHVRFFNIFGRLGSSNSVEKTLPAPASWKPLLLGDTLIFIFRIYPNHGCSTVHMCVSF